MTEIIIATAVLSYIGVGVSLQTILMNSKPFETVKYVPLTWPLVLCRAAWELMR